MKEFNEAGVVTTLTWTPAKTDLPGRSFPKTMQVELGVKESKAMLKKAASAEMGERKVDGGVRPANLPNPRKYRA